MILVFGGTTEGRAAVETLDEAGQTYYYSTRGNGQQVECIHGIRLAGAMEVKEMIDFCREHGIQLLVDAAHPFAEQLHKNIGQAAEELNIPVVRYERIYPPRDPDLIWCDSYAEACVWLKNQGIRNLLALSGVQTIPKLKAYWLENLCWFRVLDRPESRQLALKYGFPAGKLIFWEEGKEERGVLLQLRPDAILTKESGRSGYFREKVEAARKSGIPVVVIKRPALPEGFYVVTGNNGLRHRIERLLPGFYPLHSGFTTGSCACAAAKAALSTLLTGEVLNQVTITLPDGEEVELPVSRTEKDGQSIICTVVKDAGDDPDVTNKREICAKVMLSKETGIRFAAGKGVGIVTLPGLGLEIGEPAINPTPRKMMAAETEKILEAHRIPKQGVVIEISVPDGEELALKTFNPKLGIVGGISIIGTSGVVRPFSSEAFVATIRKEIQVAKALGCRHIVINSGAKSERILRERFPEMIPQAFVHYGNYIEETLKIIEEEGIGRVTMGIMIGKAVKLAEGHGDTHSRNVVMNRDFIIGLAKEAGCDDGICARISEMTLARELWNMLPADHPFFSFLLKKCEEVCYSYIKGEKKCIIELMLISEESL